MLECAINHRFLASVVGKSLLLLLFNFWNLPKFWKNNSAEKAKASEALAFSSLTVFWEFNLTIQKVFKIISGLIAIWYNPTYAQTGTSNNPREKQWKAISFNFKHFLFQVPKQQYFNSSALVFFKILLLTYKNTKIVKIRRKIEWNRKCPSKAIFRKTSAKEFLVLLLWRLRKKMY